MPMEKPDIETPSSFFADKDPRFRTRAFNNRDAIIEPSYSQAPAKRLYKRNPRPASKKGTGRYDG